MSQTHLQKAIEIARKLHPTTPKGRGGFYHYAFLFKKKRLISIGQNSEVESPKALYFGKRFNLEKAKKYCCVHAEVDAISKAWGKYYIDGTFSLLSIRLNNQLLLRNAKPCDECSIVINALGITDVYYSDAEENIIQM